MKILITILLSAFGAAAFAVEPACYVDPRTEAATCVDLAAMKIKNSIRYATIFTGGPLGLTKTAFTVHVNCEAKIAHLKDRQGVSFAGGGSDSTPLLKSLSADMCAKKVKTKK